MCHFLKQTIMMKCIDNSEVCRIPDGSEAEGHEQQDGHDTHGPLVVCRVAALKNKQRQTKAAGLLVAS